MTMAELRQKHYPRDTDYIPADSTGKKPYREIRQARWHGYV